MNISNTRLTVRCCYLGMVVLALAINLTPPLFIPLREILGLTFEQIGRLILINFATQVTFDVLCGALVDRLGAKRFVVSANLLAFLGLWLFALSPSYFQNPYHGLVLGTVVFSMGAGILELLLSPIVNAMPSDRKAADMSLLHSFYAIGQLVVILATALAVFALGAKHWRLIVLAWSAVPALNALGFSLVHIPRFVEEHQRQRVRTLLRKRAYVVAVLAIGLAGATELVMAQWISAFADVALALPKIIGDLGGLCLFAVALAAGRVWFGFKGEKVCMYRVMIAGAWLCVGVYLVASLSPSPIFALSACVIAGLGCSLLWPGILSVTAARFPLAGASMFAVLSAAGDTGGAIVPWLVGLVADRAPALRDLLAHLMPAGLTAEQLGLRTGLLLATICPLAMLTLLYWLQAESRRREPADPTPSAESPQTAAPPAP